MLQQLILGDNQFFGINHMSEEKARAQAQRFHDTESILRVLDDAYASGVRAFMCTTHERMAQICDAVREDPTRFPELDFYPSMPYAHKYANAVTERGMLGALRQFIPDDGVLSAALRGGKALATKDVDVLIRLLVDAEMKSFAGVRTPVVFLQNVVVDLLLGLGFTSAFEVFDDHVRTKYGAEPGFITMNLPLLLDTLEHAGIANPIVCSNINSLGFRMSGGIDNYTQVLEEGRCRAVAMSVFASGAIAPREAIEWVCGQPGVQSIVFGASSARNIQSTYALVQEFWPTSDGPVDRLAG